MRLPMLIANGELLALMGGLFQLVDESNGVVFERDATVAFVICDEIALSKSEFAGSLTGLKVGGGTEVCPVNV